MSYRRDPVLLLSSTFLAVISALALAESLSWVDRPFAGFLLLENKIIASAGLANWPATSGGSIYQYAITSVNGEPLRAASDLTQRVQDLEVGTPISYEMERSGVTTSRVIPTRPFTKIDYALLFGSLLFNGLALGVMGLMVRYLRGPDSLSTGTFSLLFVAGCWAITAVDIYGPYRLFRLHAAFECLLPATVIHMTLVFPRSLAVTTRRPWLIPSLYAAASFLSLVNQFGLHAPTIYRATHQIAVFLFAVALVFLIAIQLRWYIWPTTFEVRQRVKIVALGAFASLTVPLLLALGSAITGGETPQNAMSFTAFFYPLSIGYASLRHNVLEVDKFVRRTLSYFLLSLLATLAYVALVNVGDSLFRSSPRTTNDVLGLLVSLGFVLALLPLRNRVQSLVDRTFFRSAYDFARVVETTSARLASVSDLDVISGELSAAIGDTLHSETLRLYVRRPETSEFRPHPAVPDEAAAFQPPWSDLADTTRPLDTLGAGLAVPCRVRGILVGAIQLGRQQSGQFYGADDRRLLQTLANQAAVAIENALALEQLRDLNRDLEKKVEERTRALKEAHSQLVHREKMASLGQVVAGIAHEINNPLNFIQGNLFCLRENIDLLRAILLRYEESVANAPPEIRDRLLAIRSNAELDEVLSDLDLAFDGCSEGVTRSTTLVSDLRAFSQMDRSEPAPANLESCIDSSLNLLRSRFDNITVIKDFGSIPDVQCLVQQLDQVFINLLSNACDAIDGHGEIHLKTRQLDQDHVTIEVSDTGCGIDAVHLDRIFDPFFTTKEVGKGTGLGLSISYEILARHGGTIRVFRSAPSGTTFHITLPIAHPNHDSAVLSASTTRP